MSTHPICITVLGNYDYKQDDTSWNTATSHIYSSMTQYAVPSAKCANNLQINTFNMNIDVNSNGDNNNDKIKIQATMHWMQKENLLYYISPKKFHKSFNTILCGSSALIYYQNIYEENIDLIRKENYKPKKTINCWEVNRLWIYWKLNQLLLTLCRLIYPPKQLFFILYVNNDAKSKVMENYRTKIIDLLLYGYISKYTSRGSFPHDIFKMIQRFYRFHALNLDLLPITMIDDEWVKNTQNYIQHIITKCGWNELEVKCAVLPIKDENNDNDKYHKFYQEEIFDELIIPQKLKYMGLPSNIFQNEGKNLRMIIKEAFYSETSEQLILIGQITHGFIALYHDQECYIYPSKLPFIVHSLELNKKSIPFAEIGQYIGIGTGIGDYRINREDIKKFDGFPKFVVSKRLNTFKQINKNQDCMVSITFCNIYNYNNDKRLTMICCNETRNIKIKNVEINHDTSLILKALHNVLHDDIKIIVPQEIQHIIFEFMYDHNNNKNDIFTIKKHTKIQPDASNIHCIIITTDSSLSFDATTKPYDRFILRCQTHIVGNGKFLNKIDSNKKYITILTSPDNVYNNFYLYMRSLRGKKM